MPIPPFEISRLPRIHFGAGTLARVPELVAALGRRALIVTGARSFRTTPRWPALTRALEEKGVAWLDTTVSGEPSPEVVDEAVARLRGEGIEVVVAIGGGSVLDAAKAISGLLPHGNSVMDHLEGVGRGLAYEGPALPFIAVPTTAGTGSEATRNAVLSRHGAGGFKKSFRHEALVPEHAVVDPDLLESCPPELIAADGMDAFTQLLESFVSLRANPFIDALAWSGMEAAREGLLQAFEGEAEGRGAMAYAALLSGITLAQVGLGAVHGLAAPLGALFPVPHGVACGTLLAETTRANIEALNRRAPDSPALEKYARVGRLLARDPHLKREAAHEALVERLRHWQERLAMPGLGHFGIGREDLDRIVADCRGSSMQTNPIVLTDAELRQVLEARL